MKLSRFISLGALVGLSVTPLASCSDEDKPEAGSLGGSCDPSASSPCKDDLECTSAEGGGNVCTHRPGAGCDPDDADLKNGGCSTEAVCESPPSGAGGASGEPICQTTEGGVCDPDEAFCAEGLTCAEVENGEHRCFARVVMRGDVTDTTDGAGIEAAQVIAIDEEGVAVSDVAVTNVDGNYELDVPVLRTEDGTPVDASFTLRGSAQDYQPFPEGVRVALPIEVSGAVQEDGIYVLDSSLTDIGLIPLEAGDRTMISGQITALEGDAAGEVGGVLVVATGDAGSFSAITDSSGNYTIFNVPDGEYDIRAYAADIQVETGGASVAGEPVSDVNLAQAEGDNATVNGNVQIVNAPGGSQTSVILVVEDTFDPNVARGEVPRGLRAPRTGAPNVNGDFTIEGVPVGRYVVLAAYENDDLVRDPDTNIAGTDFVTLEVTEGDTTIDIADSFKVTEALATVSPGADAAEAVDSKPMLEWADDSSEDWYDVRVFDSFGNEVWAELMLPGVSGSDTVTVQYDGPLEPGMYYQFRVSSWRQPGGGEAAPISMTEDLRGVFYLPAP